jgi:hypothetical protein
MSDRERFVWQRGIVERVEGTVEPTPEDEREVDRRLEAAAFDLGLDDNDGFYWSDPDR